MKHGYLTIPRPCIQCEWIAIQCEWIAIQFERIAIEVVF